jgi:hypothetical protein
LETNAEMPVNKLYVSGKEMVLVHFFTCKSYSSSLKKWLAHHLPAQLRTNALLLLTGAYSEQMFFYPEPKLLLTYPYRNIQQFHCKKGRSCSLPNLNMRAKSMSKIANTILEK